MVDNIAVDIPVVDNDVQIEPPNPTPPNEAGDQASTSRSISSQIRDRKYLTQNYDRDSLIAAGGYSLGSDNKYPGR